MTAAPQPTFRERVAPLINQLGPSACARITGAHRESITNWRDGLTEPNCYAFQWGVLNLLGKAALKAKDTPARRFAVSAGSMVAGNTKGEPAGPQKTHEN